MYTSSQEIEYEKTDCDAAIKILHIINYISPYLHL